MRVFYWALFSLKTVVRETLAVWFLLCPSKQEFINSFWINHQENTWHQFKHFFIVETALKSPELTSSFLTDDNLVSWDGSNFKNGNLWPVFLSQKRLERIDMISNTSTGSLADRIKARINMPSEKKNWVHQESKQRGFLLNILNDDLQVKVKPLNGQQLKTVWTCLGNEQAIYPLSSSKSVNGMVKNVFAVVLMWFSTKYRWGKLWIALSFSLSKDFTSGMILQITSGWRNNQSSKCVNFGRRRQRGV